jgi:hypothetical protein
MTTLVQRTADYYGSGLVSRAGQDSTGWGENLPELSLPASESGRPPRLVREVCADSAQRARRSCS